MMKSRWYVVKETRLIVNYLPHVGHVLIFNKMISIFFSYSFMSHYDTPMARKDTQHVSELSPKLDPPKNLIVVQRL
jgi:hypothetical protein